MTAVAAWSDLVVTALLLALAAVAALRRLTPPSPWRMVAVGAILGVLPVFGYWLAGRSSANAVGGLIQWNDAAIYLGCARSLVAGAPFEATCAMRPYYTGFLGGLLMLAGGHVQAALLAQGAVAGAGTAWFAATIARREGMVAGLAVFAALFVFASQFTMAALTENAGLLLGSLALAVLWRRGRSVGAGEFFAAMAVLGLGLNARAGAMFVLPALLLWCFLETEGSRRIRLWRTAAGAAGLAVSFVANGWLVGALGGGALSAHSNLAYNAYAMAVGGDRWPRILMDHPELAGMEAEKFAPIAYGLAWQAFLDRPYLLALGYAKGLVHWLYEIFRFVDFAPLRAVLAGLWGLGLLHCWTRRQDDRIRLLAAMMAGTVMSSPFLTWFGGNRVFAVTHPADAILVGLGAAWLAGRAGAIQPTTRGEGRPGPLATATALAVTVAAIIAVPVGKAWPLLQPVAAMPNCAEGERPVVAELGRETTAIRLTDGSPAAIWPPAFAAEDFVRLLDIWLYDRENLAALTPGTAMVQAMQRMPVDYGQTRRFLWDGPLPEAGLVAACLAPPRAGQWIDRATTLGPLGP
ncbi:MAG: hypothetical protein AB1918_07285 [Pseudomonadota bacterium]